MTVDPLSLTFDTLAGSNRPGADDVLIAALDVPQPAAREMAAAAIVRRGSVRGFVELLRRFSDLSDAARVPLADASEPLTRALRQSLRQGDEGLILQTLLAVRYGMRVDQTPLVAELLRADSDRIRDQASDAVALLVDRLYDLLNRQTVVARSGRLEAGRVRDETLEALMAACEQFDRLPDPIGTLEQIFSLATLQHPAVTKVMRQSSPECRQLAEEVLSKSRHPGVMRLQFEFLSEPYPPRRIYDTLRTRDDPEFIAALLRWFPLEPTAVQVANCRQIESVPWLSDLERIASIPESLQGRLPAFILATGLPESRKMELQEWVVRNGSAAGRRSATQVFDRLDFETTRRILLDSLDSTDDDISAWATTQLRPRHVPGAFRMLIERLDSPAEPVRQAARDQLKGFTIEHLVAIHDRLSPSLCRRAGQLVRKVDPDCLATLAGMIAGHVQRQRIAAARAVGRLGMAGELRHVLLALLTERDNTIRRVGVEVLAHDRSPEVLDALREMTSDPSPRVRHAAERALMGDELVEALPS